MQWLSIPAIRSYSPRRQGQDLRVASVYVLNKQKGRALSTHLNCSVFLMRPMRYRAWLVENSDLENENTTSSLNTGKSKCQVHHMFSGEGYVQSGKLHSLKHSLYNFP